MLNPKLMPFLRRTQTCTLVLNTTLDLDFYYTAAAAWSRATHISLEGLFPIVKNANSNEGLNQKGAGDTSPISFSQTGCERREAEPPSPLFFGGRSNVQQQTVKPCQVCPRGNKRDEVTSNLVFPAAAATLCGVQMR